MGEVLFGQERSQDYHFVKKKDMVKYSPSEMYSASSDGFSSSSVHTSDNSDDDDDDVSSPDSRKGLYDLSELMAQLPIKRGLSQHFQGKSESFKNLSKATSIEDLPKKEVPKSQKKNIKFRYNRSNRRKKLILPKPVIKKKNSGNLFSSSFCTRRRTTSFKTFMQQQTQDLG